MHFTNVAFLFLLGFRSQVNTLTILAGDVKVAVFFIVDGFGSRWEIKNFQMRKALQYVF